VTGARDKRNYTANLACSAAGDVLPPQIIFEGKKKLPKKPSPVQYPDMKEYLYSLSPNHWANVSTMKRYISDLVVPYLMKVWWAGCGHVQHGATLDQHRFQLDAAAVEQTSL
jgi:hypothetical protein